MVGLSSSGKSTVANKIKEVHYIGYPKYDDFGRTDKAIIVSSDTIRKELFGNESDQSDNQLVFQTVRQRIKEALDLNLHVIVDATNINIKSRKSIIETVKSHKNSYNYRLIAYIMTTPTAICKTRNNQRSRVVPEYVIDKQESKFEIPFYEEGFDEIEFSDWDFERIAFEESCASYENLKNRMKDFDQNNPNHKHTLGVHCLLCTQFIKELSNDKSLCMAGLIHDLGKLYTKVEDENNISHYYNHANVGTYKLLQNLDMIYCNRLKNDAQKFEDMLDILFYVNYHMYPFSWKEEKTKEKYKKLFGEYKYNNLMILHESDKKASGTD